MATPETVNVQRPEPLPQAHSSAVDDALRLAEGSPVKDHAWMAERAGPMCKHCLAGEDVYAAAARILAEQARWYKAEYEAWRAAYARDRKPNAPGERPGQEARELKP